MSRCRALVAFGASLLLSVALGGDAGRRMNLPQQARTLILPEQARLALTVALGRSALGSPADLDPAVRELLLGSLPEDWLEACATLWGSTATALTVRGLHLLRDGTEATLLLAFRCGSGQVGSAQPEEGGDYDERLAVLTAGAARAELRFLPLAISESRREHRLYVLLPDAKRVLLLNRRLTESRGEAFGVGMTDAPSFVDHVQGGHCYDYRAEVGESLSPKLHDPTLLRAGTSICLPREPP